MTTRIAVFTFAFLYGISSFTLAQSQTTGSISGFVEDATRGMLPGVVVTAQHNGTGLARSTIVTATGSYALLLLPPGKYAVSFSLDGFQTRNYREITVNATERVTLNVTLNLAEVTTSVDVSAEAPLVQTETTALGRVIDERMIASLPLPTKNYTQLLALSPGAAASIADTAALGRGSINISSSGARVVANSFTLDGVDANNIHQNLASENTVGSNGAPVPSTEVIQEFKVQTSQYDAQSGRNGGASINVVTRSGTNQFRGAAYWNARRDAWNANTFFFNLTRTPRPVLRQNQGGATLGGPLRRDRTFFFLGYQGTRQVNGASLSTSQRSLILPQLSDIRTPQALGSIFGGQSGRNGGVAVAPDGSNINPVALALLNYKLPNGQYLIPSPQRAGAGVNYSVSIPALFEEEQATINLDHSVSSANRVSLRIFGANTPQTRPFSQGLNPPGFESRQDLKNRNVALTNVWIFGSRTLNEIRVGRARPTGEITGPGGPFLQDIGMTRVNAETIPQIPGITVSGQFALGYGGSSPQTVFPTIWTVQDTLSLTRSSHTIRIGAEYRKYQTYQSEPIFRGSLTFLSFPDFLLGLPAGPGGNGTPFSNIQSANLASGVDGRDYRAFDASAFVQDDWRISPRLTANLGLRYDFMQFQSDLSGTTGNFDPRLYQPPPPGGQTSAGFVLPQGAPNPFNLPVVNSSLVDRNPARNFAPRVGLAYRLFERNSVVLRGGYGVFYERISNQMILQAGNTPNFRTSMSATGVDAAYASFQRPFLDIPPIEAHPRLPVLFAPPYSPTRPLLGGSPLDPLLSTPYLQQYSANVQTELMANMLLEIGYVGSRGTNLPVKIQINQARLASPETPVNGITVNTAANAVERVPFIGYSPNGLGQNQNSSSSRYNSLQTSVTKRMSRGLQFLASYTFARSVDNSSGSFGQTLATMSGDQADMEQAWGPSDFDRRHRVVFSFAYEVPAWGGRWSDTTFGRKFFNGWQLSGVALAQGGTPLTITDSQGARLYGVSTSRASWAPGATVETAQLSGSVKDRLNRFFNTAAFLPAGNVFGNTGRGILRGPGQKNLDLSIGKTTAVTQRVKAEFRLEAFNVLNLTNFENPNTEITSSTFGQITGTSSNSRLIQMGLRILY